MVAPSPHFVAHFLAFWFSLLWRYLFPCFVLFLFLPAFRALLHLTSLLLLVVLIIPAGGGLEFLGELEGGVLHAFKLRLECNELLLLLGLCSQFVKRNY